LKAKKAKVGVAKAASASKKALTSKARIRFEVCGPYNMFGNVYTETEYDNKDDFIKPVLEGVKKGIIKTAAFPLRGTPCSRRQSHDVDSFMSSGRPNYNKPGTDWPWGCQPFVHTKDMTSIDEGYCSIMIPSIVKASKKYDESVKAAKGTVYPKTVSHTIIIELFVVIFRQLTLTFNRFSLSHSTCLSNRKKMSASKILATPFLWIISLSIRRFWKFYVLQGSSRSTPTI
jgi:hypothetical protein